MKKYTLLFLATLAAHLSHGQQTELAVHLTSGLTAYRGSSASSTALIMAPQATTGPYSGNAYGKKPGFSYGLAGQVQHVTAGRSLLGLQAGLELLRSRVAITAVRERSGQEILAAGRATLSNSFINVHPSYGRRFALNTIALDLTAGPEIGLLLRSQENGEAIGVNGARYTAKLGHSPASMDVRGRLNLTAYYKLTGLSVGYSHGLTNYRKAGDAVSEGVYSQVFRVGLSQRLAW